MKSALYRGTVRHARYAPRHHQFEYPLFMMYLDLAELEMLFAKRWLWSAERRNVASFWRRDYLGPEALPLDTAVRDRVAAATGARPLGPIRLLTHLRYFGYAQNPVSFYYCFDVDDDTVETVVAEVTNTPWGERHAYVLPMRHGGTGPCAVQLQKTFHVSPFMPMELDYDWLISPPDERLRVRMSSLRDGAVCFDATLDLQRYPLTARAMAGALARFPWMTAQIVVGIYWQAFWLWVKRIPFHTHPAKRSTDGPPLNQR